MSIKFKAFLILGVTAYAVAQGYMWSHDTTFTAETNKLMDSGQTYLVNKKNDAVSSTKQAIRDGFDASAEKIGIKKDAVKTENKPADPKVETPKNTGKSDEAKKEEPKKEAKEDKPALSWLYQVKFKYDHTGAPDGISESQMLGMIKNASDVWEKACGVKFKMDGIIRSDYISAQTNGTSHENFGIIRWTDMGGDTLGQAHLGGKNGPVGDFIMDINSNMFADAKGKINTDSLQATMTHELGHVLGLDHSRLPASVMHFQQKTFNKDLNDGDTQMCINTVAEWAKNPANKKFKI
jgi:Matrixin